jgi:hypothetical protein
LKAASLSSFIPSAPGKNKDKNSLQDGLNINEKGIVCQEESITGLTLQSQGDFLSRDRGGSPRKLAAAHLKIAWAVAGCHDESRLIL